MAKKKEEVIEPIEVVEEVAEVSVNSDAFIERKLKAINSMEKPLKAQRVANRLLRKARK